MIPIHGPTLGSDHRNHSHWQRGVKVVEVGRGEGTPVELVNLHISCSFHHNFWKDWARTSRLLRFWRKFKYLTNDYILFNISSLLRRAMRQKQLLTFQLLLLCLLPPTLVWHYYFGRPQKCMNLSNWTGGCTGPGVRIAKVLKLLMGALEVPRENASALEGSPRGPSEAQNS